jgi:hypothetical protein
MTLTPIFSRIKWIGLFDKLFPMVLVFFLALGQSRGMESAENSQLYHDVKRGANFYVGKIKDKNLWMAMEHIDSSDVLSCWLKYIGVQYTNYKLGYTLQGKDGKAIMPGFSKDGSEHFLLVLQDQMGNARNPNTDEVWVAYVTTNQNPEPITAYKNNRIHNYDINYLPRNRFYDRNNFPGNILMYVTITSSPNALVTSHMGVSVSLEGIEQRKDGIGYGISMDLHSFAAKVMLIRNPNRKYMINAPVEGMEKLIAQGLPSGSFFAGTREMKEKIDEAKKITFDDFKSSINMQELAAESRKRLERIVLNFNQKIKYLKKDRNDNVISEDYYKENIEHILDKAKNLSLEINEDNILSITEDSTERFINENIEDRYSKIQPEYSFTGWPGVNTIDKLMKKYPPLLSVDGRNNISIDRRMTIFDRYDPAKPWLTIHFGDPDYHWIFSPPFAPAGQTHYIVADLKSMADSKQLDPMN